MVKLLNFERYVAIVAGIFSATGLVASLVLSVERFSLLKDSGHQLSCSINATFNCASVMNSWQAELLGFPNSFLGLVGYAVVLTIALHMLLESHQHKFMTWISLVGSSIAAIFSYWLILESVFTIKALCLYCIISCISATNIFFAILLYSFKQNIFNIKEGNLKKINNFINKGYYWPIVAAWYFVLFLLVFLEIQGR